MRPTPVVVEVYTGVVSGSWNGAVALLGFGIAGLIGLAYLSFEGSRIDTDDEDD